MLGRAPSREGLDEEGCRTWVGADWNDGILEMTLALDESPSARNWFKPPPVSGCLGTLDERWWSSLGGKR